MTLIVKLLEKGEVADSNPGMIIGPNQFDLLLDKSTDPPRTLGIFALKYGLGGVIHEIDPEIQDTFIEIPKNDPIVTIPFGLLDTLTVTTDDDNEYILQVQSVFNNGTFMSNS